LRLYITQILFMVLTIFTLLVTSNSAKSQGVDSKPLSTSQIELEQYIVKNKGKVIYLDFWASWCGPCRKSFPWMNSIQASYKQQGFTIISINLDANKTLADKFLIETPATFPVIYDAKGILAKHYKIKGMPSSILIGRDGMIKSRHAGFFNNKVAKYQQEIELLLAQP